MEMEKEEIRKTVCNEGFRGVNELVVIVITKKKKRRKRNDDLWDKYATKLTISRTNRPRNRFSCGSTWNLQFH